MNKFFWFVLGSITGGFATKKYMDNYDAIEDWISKKLGMESPSSMFFDNDTIKEGIHNALDKNDIGGASNRTGSSSDRIRLSNIIHSQRYSENDVQPSENSNEESESLQLVNENTLDGYFDNTKIYNNITIDKYSNSSAPKITVISKDEYLHSSTRFRRAYGYSISSQTFVINEHTSNEECIDIDSMRLYIGDFVMNYIKSATDPEGELGWTDDIYLYNKNADLYIRLYLIDDTAD